MRGDRLGEVLVTLFAFRAGLTFIALLAVGPGTRGCAPGRDNWVTFRSEIELLVGTPPQDSRLPFRLLVALVRLSLRGRA
jgi:hypothetical protein